jgi:L-aspartate semialdehyde sulfurtransferase ferredoxin
MKKFRLTYSSENAGKPILAQAILKTGVLVNILTIDAEYQKESLIISVLGDEKAQDRLLGFLRDCGVDVDVLEGKIEKDKDKCVDCCKCWGVCPTEAITVKDRQMNLDPDECVSCGLCVDACPTRALSIKK